MRGDEWTDERRSPCVLQDFVPFGAAAQKLLVQNKLKPPCVLKNFKPLRAAGAALLPLTKTPDFNAEACVLIV